MTTAKQREQQRLILESLRYTAMKEREENIKDAHKSTLQWAFNNPEVELIQWLEEENGIFWVKGKVGKRPYTVPLRLANV